MNNDLQQQTAVNGINSDRTMMNNSEQQRTDIHGRIHKDRNIDHVQYEYFQSLIETGTTTMTIKQWQLMVENDYDQ